MALLEITFDPDRIVEEAARSYLLDEACDLLGPDVGWIDVHDERYGRFRRMSVWRAT